MNKAKIVVLIVVVILSIFLFFYFAFPDKNADVKYEIIVISSKEIQAKLFIKKKVWGITSDNQVIVVSASDKKQFLPDVTKDYIYEGVTPLFYKIQKDTLYIYSLIVSSIPKNLKTRFQIKQVQLENSEMMKLLEHENYKSKGLMIVN